LLGTEAADAVEVESGHSQAEENGHLDLSKYQEKPSTEVDEGALQGRVHGFNDLPSTHRNSPRCGAKRDPLTEGELNRSRREFPSSNGQHPKEEQREVLGASPAWSFRPADFGARRRRMDSATGSRRQRRGRNAERDASETAD
jgi:hypothetical protein